MTNRMQEGWIYTVIDLQYALQKLHDAIDDLNVDVSADAVRLSIGDAEQSRLIMLCLLCRSKCYDARGIVHADDCPLLLARRALS